MTNRSVSAGARHGAVLLLVLLAAACGPKRIEIDGVELGPEDAADYLYKEGVEARAQGNLPTARGRFLEILSDFEGTKRVPDALFELAAVVRQQEGCDAARAYYEKFVLKHSTHGKVGAARDALSRCAEEHESSAAEKELLERFESTKDGSERARVAREAAVTAGSGPTRLEWLMKARQSDPSKANELEVEIRELVDQGLAAEELGALGDDLADAFPKDLILYKLGKILLHTRKYSAAQTTFAKLIEKFPKGKEAKDARTLLDALTARSNLEPTTIGVLLPLSGKWKGYGQNGVDASRLAVGDLEDKPDKRVKIVVKDTKGDPIDAARAVEELVAKDGAIMIVGAIFRKEALGAANKAQELGVPFITVSAQEDLTQLGAYVFRSGLTDAAQVDALVQYVMDVLGMKTFGILHPRHPYGEAMRDLFWSRVEARKGLVRAVESYGDRETTLTGPVKDLVGRSNLEGRSDFHQALAACDKQPDATRKARCRDRVEQDIKPLIDFEGLFIPDYPDTLVLIAPALAAEDVVVETNPRYLEKIEKTMGRKVKPVRLLGASGWNYKTLPEKAGRYVENAMFSDAFFMNADHEETKRFVSAFQKSFKREPTSEDAMMFDTVRLAKHVILTFAPKSREDARQAIRAVHDFPGVTGKLSFRASNEVARDVRILYIENGNIREASVPSEKAPK
ncbi:MAG: penicillin-binding protein activator [Deltaproteobacteria bacterium]|nr:penicillin-binding protein activator [Deltaproteobacteria bacterium]